MTKNIDCFCSHCDDPFAERPNASGARGRSAASKIHPEACRYVDLAEALRY